MNQVSQASRHQLATMVMRFALHAGSRAWLTHELGQIEIDVGLPKSIHESH